MSSTKIYYSQQFQQLNPDGECPRCHEQQEIYIELVCGHKFCIVCITYSYLKFKNSIADHNKVQCLECGALSEMDQQPIGLINDIIQKDIGPIINNQSEELIEHSRAYSRDRQEFNSDSSKEKYLYSNEQDDNFKNSTQPMLRSYEQSFLKSGNITPSLSKKYFLSKGESPLNNKSIKDQHTFNKLATQPGPSSDICLLHPSQELTYVCMTCSLKPLCYKCIKSTKHNQHQVKIMKKAFQILQQRSSLINLEMIQKVENLQLFRKRLNDRKKLFKDRLQKNVQQLDQTFANLIKRIQLKASQIIKEYQQFFDEVNASIDYENHQAEELIEKINEFRSKISTLNENFGLTKGSNNDRQSPNSNGNNNGNSRFNHRHEEVNNQPNIINKPSFYFTSYYNLIENQKQNISTYQDLKSITTKSASLENYQKMLEPINYQNVFITRQITVIMEEVQRLCLTNKNIFKQKQKNILQSAFVSMNSTEKFKNSTKNATLFLRNCSSRDKLFQKDDRDSDHFKRVKTNVASLNTSRQKRDNKNTKTEQDQRRLKSKANYKTQTQTQTQTNTHSKNPYDKHQLPSYITKCLQKNNTKISPFNGGYTQMMDQMHSSKNNNSKVSKSNVQYQNDNFQQKKKKQSLKSGMTKEGRLERKTVHALNNLKQTKILDGIKKKK